MSKFAYLLSKLGVESAGRGVAILAPMSGVTDLGMRRIAQQFGATLVVSEMVDGDLYAEGDAANRIKAEGEGIVGHVVQIAGCVPGRIAEAARLAEAQGGAMVDINMGCPAKSVVGGQAGSALMRDIDQAVRLIRAAVGAVSIPVSLKMRLGWDESSINAPELASRAEAEGAVMVTVHGRTRCQFYQGRADWAAIRTVVEAVAIPVVANGDCATLADAQTILSQSRAAAVMVGRAAIGQPWVVGAIARGLDGDGAEAIGVDARRAAAAIHYATLLSLYGKERGVRHARKHLAGYAMRAGCRPGSSLHTRLVTETDPDRVFRLLAAVFDQPKDLAA